MNDSIYLILRIVALGAFFMFFRYLASVSKGPVYKSYLTSLGIALLLAFVAWGKNGTHSEGGDYLYDQGETVTDFVPSEEERLEHGLLVLVVMSFTAIGGTTVGLKQRK